MLWNLSSSKKRRMRRFQVAYTTGMRKILCCPPGFEESAQVKSPITHLNEHVRTDQQESEEKIEWQRKRIDDLELALLNHYMHEAPGTSPSVPDSSYQHVAQIVLLRNQIDVLQKSLEDALSQWQVQRTPLSSQAPLFNPEDLYAGCSSKAQCAFLRGGGSSKTHYVVPKEVSEKVSATTGVSEDFAAEEEHTGDAFWQEMSSNMSGALMPVRQWCHFEFLYGTSVQHDCKADTDIQDEEPECRLVPGACPCTLQATSSSAPLGFHFVREGGCDTWYPPSYPCKFKCNPKSTGR